VTCIKSEAFKSKNIIDIKYLIVSRGMKVFAVRQVVVLKTRGLRRGDTLKYKITYGLFNIMFK